ncbi:MAG: leucyl aminopeptidase [Dehalococcoidales bacterium]|nr:leucyl aminopeptidase [Dehalococcoidales bacterium]
MEIKIVTDTITNVAADALIVDYYEGAEKIEGNTAEIDKALGGAISQMAKQGDIKGKSGEINLIPTQDKIAAARVVVCGMGKPKDLSLNKIRETIAETCRWLRKKSVKNIATIVPGAGMNGITTKDAAQAIAEGAVLGLYTFRKYITKKDDDFGEIAELKIITDVKNKPAAGQTAATGQIIAEATNFARGMANEPSNYMTPALMAETAAGLARKHGLEITVFDRAEMQELGMGGLLGVAQGSQQPPKFITLKYQGRKSNDIDLALVGKGITFDSGGISIKPSEGMADMKGDMAGGAAVMATVSVLAQLKVALNVTALVPATENMPSGSALKPGDIITTSGGKTVEVLNTDAEGRLILADALCYANKLGAKRIIDIATLTGACAVALGTICSGAFTNNQELLDKVLAAGKEAGEYIWQLPLFDEYREMIKGSVADIKNTGNRYGGAITAAKFLQEFAGDTPWVHLDIAGTNDTDKDKGYQVKGATGVPVRTLVNFAVALAQNIS